MRFLVLLSIVGVLIVGFYQNYVSALNYSSSPDAERVVVRIEQGSGASQIADQLADEGLIKSELMFKLYLKQTDQANQLKAGAIVLQRDQNLKEIVAALVEGRTAEIPVTLLEGWTVEQIGEHLEELELTTVEDFLTCAKECNFEYDFLPEGYVEGYLYPDTYFVNFESYSDKSFMARLMQTLNNKLSDDDLIAIKQSGRTLEQIMTMASIVEREERNSAEQPTVAGILWNRYDEGAGLGADATVLYALGRTSGGLNYNDLQVDSPYNTRKYRGLPPTPIANPGISSIRAAIYPEKTSYWYYLHDPTGKIHYARTLDEHNENKRRYL